jgi:hypothetical protein
MANAKKLTVKRIEKFCEVLRESCNVTLAAETIGVSRSHVYQARKRNKAFREAWDNALNEGLDKLEAEIVRRGFRGVETPVHYAGKRVDTIRKYSDKLAMFFLKAHRPEKYRERAPVEHPGGAVRSEVTIYLPDNGRDPNLSGAPSQSGRRRLTPASPAAGRPPPGSPRRDD